MLWNKLSCVSNMSIFELLPRFVPMLGGVVKGVAPLLIPIGDLLTDKWTLVGMRKAQVAFHPPIPLYKTVLLSDCNGIYLRRPRQEKSFKSKWLNLEAGVGMGIVRLGLSVSLLDSPQLPFPELENVASHPVGLLLVKCAWHFSLGGCVPGHMCLCARGM